MFSGQPVEMTATGFEQHLSRNDIPVLVDFWVPWCGPRKLMATEFLEEAVDLEPRVRLAKVKTGAESELGSRFGIRGIPTLALYRNGRELSRQSGAMVAHRLFAGHRASCDVGEQIRVML